MTVTVIGANSMIAGLLRTEDAAWNWRFLPHAVALADTGWVKGSAVVINLAFDPVLKTVPYHQAYDIDLRLATLLAPGRARYITTSSRMVYGTAPEDGRLVETMPARPTSFYGKAKLRAEEAAAALLGPRLTVLRLSNIFDGSEARGERRSFFGLALRNLRDHGRITFDMSPFVARDFLPARQVAAALATMATCPQPGLFNLGAGFATPAGRIAEWLIAGHGRGILQVSDFREHDGFWLDMTRTHRSWTLPGYTAAGLQDDCVAIGRGLAASLKQVSA